MKRRSIASEVRETERLAVIGLRRGRGRREVIRQDMAHLQLTEDKALDRRAWMPRIRVGS